MQVCETGTEGVQEEVWCRPAQCAFPCHVSFHRIRTAFWGDVEMTGPSQGRCLRPGTSEEGRQA